MEAIDTALQVNKLAQKARHLKIFSKTGLVRLQASETFGAVAGKVFAPFNRVLAQISKATDAVRQFIPAAPQKKLLFEGALLSIVGILVSSLNLGEALVVETYAANVETYTVSSDILVADEEGYLVKINPQTSSGNRIGMTDYAVHTVASGEVLSSIAEKYGISVNTIMWENGLSNANTLKIGQKLMIPPVNGISYTVASGETLDSIAKKFKITADAITTQNALQEKTLVKGQHLFLPGAEPIAPPVIAGTSYGRNTAVTRSTRVDYSSVSSSSAVPAVGKIFIYPTQGNITNGYHKGHYAIDIADRSKPPVWAAGGGTVEKVSTGTWGGGYGNHVIINHGDGYKTLYAHLDSVNVSDGQWVNQGDVIGIMGNTGRVYGATGIHLHWEVIYNGSKLNPNNYY